METPAEFRPEAELRGAEQNFEFQGAACQRLWMSRDLLGGPDPDSLLLMNLSQ